MSTIFMSPKGGNCTTVTACAFAYLNAIRGNNTVLLDLCGDVPAVLGLAEPTSPGVNEWLGESSCLTSEELVLLGTPIMPGLVIVHLGAHSVEGEPRWAQLAEAIQSLPHTVVIDAGTGFLPDVVRGAVQEVTMVTRPCYLSLRHATHVPKPTNVFVIEEPQRALTTKDVGHVLGVPISARIPFDPAISRAVDAGLLPSRVEQLFGQHITNI